MLTITHSKYPNGKELRALREQVMYQDTLFPPPYIMAAMRLQYAMDEGAGLALATNAILIKWIDGPDGRGTMERLMYSENEDNYIVDLCLPFLL